MGDSGIGPDVQSGSVAGIGHQIAHGHVQVRPGQGSAARLTVGATLGTDDGEVVGVAVGILGQGKHRGVDHVASAVGDVSAGIGQDPMRTLEQAGECGAVGVQQTGGRGQL